MQIWMTYNTYSYTCTLSYYTSSIFLTCWVIKTLGPYT